MLIVMQILLVHVLVLIPIILWHLSPFGLLAKLVETAHSISPPLCLSDFTKFVNYPIVPRPRCT